MGALLNQPVGYRVQFIETGTGFCVEIDDLLFSAPEGLHAGQAIENKMDIS